MSFVSHALDNLHSLQAGFVLSNFVYIIDFHNKNKF